MQYRHQEALAKSVMLEHASQTSGVMYNVHDKPCSLPYPDIIFAFDIPPPLALMEEDLDTQMLRATSAKNLAHSETLLEALGKDTPMVRAQMNNAAGNGNKPSFGGAGGAREQMNTTGGNKLFSGANGSRGGAATSTRNHRAGSPKNGGRNRNAEKENPYHDATAALLEHGMNDGEAEAASKTLYDEEQRLLKLKNHPLNKKPPDPFADKNFVMSTAAAGGHGQVGHHKHQQNSSISSKEPGHHEGNRTREAPQDLSLPLPTDHFKSELDPDETSTTEAEHQLLSRIQNDTNTSNLSPTVRNFFRQIPGDPRAKTLPNFAGRTGISCAKVSYSYKCITNLLSMRNKICNAYLASEKNLQCMTAITTSTILLHCIRKAAQFARRRRAARE